MMKFFASIIALILCGGYVFSQPFSHKQGNIWYFGDSAGVDFNSGAPVALTNGAIHIFQGFFGSHIEGTASISDSAGNVLFYTDGMTVYNKNHQLMSNGAGLLGHFSTTQSSIIIPRPGSSRHFYVFTLDDYWVTYFFDRIQNGFRYSVVDMCEDNELGAVLTDQKNIVLLGDSITEKLAAVKHANGMDYWVVVHRLYTDEFYAFLLTANGISDPVISRVGTVHNEAQGQMKISPDGNKLAIAIYKGTGSATGDLELFDFNRTTGAISNLRPVRIPTAWATFGVEFSPDNTKLFCQYNNSNGDSESGIIQFDLNAGGGNIDSISNSLVKVHVQPNALPIKGLQLAPDGKIYQVSEGFIEAYLHAIHAPNNYGTAVNFQPNAVSLAGKEGDITLPTFVAGYDYSNNLQNCGGDLCGAFTASVVSSTEVSCLGASDGAAKATATGGTPPYSFSWSDGQNNDTPIDLAAGTYSVTVTDANGCTSSTEVIIQDELGPCTGINGKILSDVSLSPNPTSKYIWLKSESINHPSTLCIYDAFGKEIKTQIFQQNELQNGVELDLSTLSEAVYFLHISNDQGSRVFKIVKL